MSIWGALLSRILLGAAQEPAVAPRAGHALQTGDDLDEKGVHQVGDDHPQSVSAAEGEAPGDRVWLVAQFRDGGEHPGPGGVADVLAIVEDL